MLSAHKFRFPWDHLLKENRERKHETQKCANHDREEMFKELKFKRGVLWTVFRKNKVPRITSF